MVVAARAGNRDTHHRATEHVELVVHHVQRHQFLVLHTQTLGREREETGRGEAVGIRLRVRARGQ